MKSLKLTFFLNLADTSDTLYVYILCNKSLYKYLFRGYIIESVRTLLYM